MPKLVDILKQHAENDIYCINFIIQLFEWCDDNSDAGHEVHFEKLFHILKEIQELTPSINFDRDIELSLMRYREYFDCHYDYMELENYYEIHGDESKQISEKYFLGELVRIHRQGEDASYTGVKAAGTTIDKKVLAADKSIELGNLSPLENLIEKDKKAELKKRFDKVMALKNFDTNNLDAGRDYIEAYVKFFKFAEGEDDHHKKETHDKKAHH
jgi:hypothetical protein